MTKHTDSETALARLVVLSKRRSLEELTRMIPPPPDRGWKLGDRVSANSSAVNRFSGLSYESAAPRDADISAHVDDVLSRMDTHAEALATFARAAAVEEIEPVPVRLWLSLTSESTTQAFELRPDQIAAIAAMGATLAVSFLSWEKVDLPDESTAH